MPKTPAETSARLTQLKTLLQGIEHKAFEQVVAALISELLGVGIAMAKSGFQHGGDVGPGGRQERRFRIETKRYADTTSFSDRELLGEIDHALMRDPALEGWFLAATRDAPEQLENDFSVKSDQLGLPIVVIDWKEAGFPAMAALCTGAPDVLDTLVSKEAGDLARGLAADGEVALARLRLDLQAWNLGFERLRTLSHDYLDAAWKNPRTARAVLGQDVAGGAVSTTIERPTLNEAFNGWWEGRAAEDAPAIVLGNEGVGKTWATVQWLIREADKQPIVIVAPSSAVAGLADMTPAGVRRFIGDRLQEVTDSRDQKHWCLRLDRLMRRPTEEGPVLTVVLDGMNQEPSVRWLDLLKALQHPVFEGRVRVIAITRNLYFTERLHKLQGLHVRPVDIEVGLYDASHGGELDQRLAREGLTRDDLTPDLLELARTPRLFSLVVRLRHRLSDGGQVTVHRLLWEYGRDTLGVRDRSMSEQEWRTWLSEVARDRRQGVSDYNLGSIGSMVDRADLDQNDVFRRLSDIVDGRFTAGGGAVPLTLSPTIVTHALGAALLEHLRLIEATSGTDALEAELASWLDPIAAIDERAEILRAAVSIVLESNPVEQEAVLRLLVKDWLQSQNLPELHRAEIVRLAVPLCGPLLDVVEQIWGPASTLAVDALRRSPRDDAGSRDLIIARCEAWLKTISRDIDLPAHRHEDAERARSNRLVERVGVDEDGERNVLGERLTFVERIHHNGLRAVPTLLDGYPLVPAVPLLSAAAFNMAIRGRENFWDGLKWLCLLNEIDAPGVTSALRRQSVALQARPAEDGVHPGLAARIAALLLWLSGDEELEAEAVATDPGLDRGPDYQAEYLADPGRSFFSLQRRHAPQVAGDTTLPLARRIDKVSSFQVDPGWDLPVDFVGEVRDGLVDFDVSKLDSYFGRTVEDGLWEDIEPVLARAAPDLLAELVRRKLAGLVDREGDKRRIGLSRSTADFLLADRLSDEALTALEAGGAREDGDEVENKYARSRALLIAAAGLPPGGRVAFLIDRDADLYSDLAEVLAPLDRVEVNQLVERYGDGPKAGDLIRLLSLIQASPGEGSWDWFVDKALDAGFDASGTASRLLWIADRVRFGRDLHSRGWSWGAHRGDWDNHFGSLALAEANVGLPFEDTLVRIAPWLVPHAVVLRGSDPADADLAAQLLDGVLSLQGRSAPDLGSDVTISQEVRAEDPEAFTLTIREPERGSLIENLRAAADETGRAEARSRAIPVALERLRQARGDGASLFMHDFTPEDLEPLVRHAPSAVARWLDGVDGPSLDFQRRVLLAEGFYIALCEALLRIRPDDGARLWLALTAVSRTRFLGPAKVDQLTLMLHRVPTTPDALRREQLDLQQTHTDEGLFEVALASRLSGDTTWLEGFIREDEAAAETWRRQRGRILRGFLGVGDALTNEDLDLPGEVLRESREHKAGRWHRSEIWARHWWERYWAAESNEEAYAAWVLLLRVADRRAIAWMEVPDGMEERHPRRVAHFHLNYDDMVRAMKKAEKKLDKEFLGRSTYDGVHPWLKRTD